MFNIFESRIREKLKMTIRIPPENIFDKFLKLLGKKRKVLIPKESGKIYKEYGPYVQIKAKKENFWKTLFQTKNSSK